MDIERTVLVVGAGHGGVHAAAALRRRGWDGRVVLLDAESGLPYERPPLSKEVLKADQPELTLLRKPSFYEQNGIELRDDSRVVGARPDQRVVELSDGSELSYQHLVLATGARARMLPIPGVEFAGVQVLRDRNDALLLHDRLTPRHRLVVIGAGYIGMEAAAAARQRGAEVTVLEFQDRVMSRVTSEPVSQAFTELHRSKGVRFEFGVSASRIEGRDGSVVAVHTTDGRAFPADTVVVGIGIEPNAELAEAAGIHAVDGIVVDERARTNTAGVYAIGDVARFPGGWEGEHVRLECIHSAVAQAEAAAADIMGQQLSAREVPWFWTVQHGVRLQTAGLWRPEDRRVLRRRPDRHGFSVLYLRDGVLAAIDTVDALGDFSVGKRLIESRSRLDPHRAADATVKLSDAALVTEGA